MIARILLAFDNELGKPLNCIVQRRRGLLARRTTICVSNSLGVNVLKALVFLWSVSCPGESNSLEMWREDFDGPLSKIGQLILEHPLIDLVGGQGKLYSNGIKVSYVGYEEGSKRVIVYGKLSPNSKTSLLKFDVMFCPGFDFAKGGKLHGLGPAFPVGGGAIVEPWRWSARLMFRHDGGLQTYVYHQRMNGRYGDGKVAAGFNFRPGVFYSVALRVTLNDPPSASNGSIQVGVNGSVNIVHDGLQLRGLDDKRADIQSLMFSTFHGGNQPDWAPRTSSGSLKVDCAYFDNFSVED